MAATPIGTPESHFSVDLTELDALARQIDGIRSGIESARRTLGESTAATAATDDTLPPGRPRAAYQHNLTGIDTELARTTTLLTEFTGKLGRVAGNYADADGRARDVISNVTGTV